MENCRGLFGEEEKFDSSIFEAGISGFSGGIWDCF